MEVQLSENDFDDVLKSEKERLHDNVRLRVSVFVSVCMRETENDEEWDVVRVLEGEGLSDGLRDNDGDTDILIDFVRLEENVNVGVPV